MKNSYGTVLEAIEGLQQEGYTMDFNLDEECLACHQTSTFLSPDEFEIDAVFRFEGESNPDDEAVVYAISSSKLGVKGTLVNAYGPYSEAVSDTLVKKLQIHRETPGENKEAKPIKRSPHIVQLSKEHHFTLLFSWKIRQGLKQGVDAERIKKYVYYFWQADMQEHFREEEEILFAPVDDDKVRKAIKDHVQIKKLVESLKISTGEDTIQQLTTLASMVDAHVRYEERELFPHLEKILTEQQLEDIGRQINKETALPNEYEDAFWVKAE